MAGSMVTLTSFDGREFSAYLAKADASGASGIVILQEIFGINTFVREAADRFAAAGYNVIAPDLFWRQEPGLQLNPGSEEDRARAMGLMKNLDEDAAMRDAASSAAWLRDAMACERVGAVGYCLGGKLAYLAAMDPAFDATVAYYGVAIQSALAKADGIRAPLLLHIAAEDTLCPPEAQAQIVEALEPKGVRITTHAGAGHAFARYNTPAYNAAAAEPADSETSEFLTEYLK
ncbi:dienelactone hydrolase family protein [Novosphingobium beihaiensis]|uniref:Dienelactone hydrolase family protein n=1 Tax=Novosphingobium beihaiensis TaxID=2930389 RepID=A0ABT0BRE1_9SPHN|nr:dienelactone hydrolase family protein [Novosphingobium beihaiensis]MCJ2187627.1 dienelactone hydrolase family protein [Novosphingobium beihaiensis]